MESRVLHSSLHSNTTAIKSLTICLISWPAKHAARVAVVKSRDMHWSLLAQKDQRDISLASLRMLIVADGANPCESALVETVWGCGT